MPLLPPRSRLHRAANLLALSAYWLSLATSAGATVRTWANAAGGSAGTSTNWSPNGIPAAADNVLFNLANTYTVDFPASVPVVISHAYNGGKVTLTTSSPHSVSTSFSVQAPSGVILSGGNITTKGFYVANASPGVFTITSSGGIPSSPSRFEVADSVLSQGVILGNTSVGRVDVFGGSQFVVDWHDVIMANTSTSRCTLNVAGRSAFTLQNSTFATLAPGNSDMLVGLGGLGVVNVSNGGVVSISGTTQLGPRSGATGIVNLGANLFGAQYVSHGKTYIGGNQFSSTLGGSGTFTVNSGGAFTSDDEVQIGDPDGTAGASLIITGGSITARNGINVISNGNLLMSGGLTQITGGRLGFPAGRALVIAGSGVPELRLANHQASDYVNAPILGLFAGLGADAGTLRVRGAGTAFGTLGGTPCIVGSSSPSPCALDVDSLAHLDVSGYVSVGEAGLGSQSPATLRVANGAQVNGLGTLTFGASPTAAIAGTVNGAGSLLTFAQQLSVGGASPVAGGFTTVTVDTGGALRDTLGVGTATVMGPQGNLLVAHGGHLACDTLKVLGAATVDSGACMVARVLVSGGGVFGGRGDVTGTVSNSSVVHAKEDAGTFGSLRVGGFSQVTGAKLRLGLGHGTGPVNDTLAVSGAAAFGGILALEADPSFQYVVGDSFTVCTYGSRTGTFDALQWNGNFAGQVFQLVYEPHKLVAVVKTANVGVEPRDAPASLRFALAAGGAAPRLALDLPTAADVRVDLFDVTGRRVVTLQDGALAAGRHDFTVDASRRAISSGVYFARASVLAKGTTAVRTVRVPLLR